MTAHERHRHQDRSHQAHRSTVRAAGRASGHRRSVGDLNDQERNKDVVRKLYERGYTAGDESVFRELYAPDFVHHSKVLHDVPPGGEGERLSMLAFRQAMPDARFEVLELVAERDTVVARLHVTGTPVASFGHNVRAGEPFDVHAAAIFRLDGGRLAEEWYFIDAGT